jgi:hypothetical protein
MCRTPATLDQTPRAVGSNPGFHKLNICSDWRGAHSQPACTARAASRPAILSVKRSPIALLPDAMGDTVEPLLRGGCKDRNVRVREDLTIGNSWKADKRKRGHAGFIDMRGFPPTLTAWVFRPAKSVCARLLQFGCTALVPVGDALSAASL